jgi:proline iminopeptidase
MWNPTLATFLVLAGCSQPLLVPATVDGDPSLPFVALNGSKLHLEESGALAGAPLIFLHGGPGNDYVYMTRLANECDGAWLGARYRLVLWDQRGSGLSRRHDLSLLNLGMYRGDLDALVDFVDAAHTGVVMVGHSWGGQYAADYVNRHPDRVRALVLLEPGELTQKLVDSRPPAISIDYLSRWLNDFIWAQQTLSLDSHDAADFYALTASRGVQANGPDREEPPARRLGAAVIVSSQTGGFGMTGYDFTTNLSAFEKEVLFIAGDTSRDDLNATLQERQLGYFPRATLATIPGASHNDVAWADACTSVKLIDGYLSRVDPAR